MNSFDSLIEALGALHLIRPQWLWALLGLPLLAAWWRARRRRASVWRDAVDPHLLPHLLHNRADVRGQAALWFGVLAYLLAVFALAGPSWRQVEQPLWQSRTPLVIAWDLSSASLAGDLPPSRLAQARAKVATLLRERQGGQVGLVAYANDAFTVAPLTDDAQNVALFLDALSPEVMPVDGQRGDRAIQWSAQLLRQAGFQRGQILLLTDQADAAARDAAAVAMNAGYRVSVLGLGTAAGAPYRQPNGSLTNARLDADSLQSLSQRGGGRYATLAPGDADLQSLGVLEPAVADATTAEGQGRTWQDEGYWLLLPLMLLALFAFRRRGAVAVLLVCVWLPWLPAQAVEWWQRPDQATHERLREGTQAYRQGDFANAAQHYREVDSADGQYNLGNALAKAGQYPQAIAAYDRALEKQPGMADALANKQAVEAAMKRKPPSGGQQPKPDPKADQGQDGAGNPQPGTPQSPPPSPPPPPPADPTGESPPQDAPSQNTPPADADPQQQQAADAAQRERMQRALQQSGEPQGESTEPATPQRNETAAERERRLANEAWLKRVPDDPGGLLRQKFRIEHERRQRRGLGE